ncbi:MAG: aminotransferase class III-fold pyridoxal phosphate-dependent enzyme [Candidatus Bathyarchaeota archaeon]|nr:aminotransferase class III-fold pyridoxal phosphate-dependent enzyme [Candidatus Bathyarchaeota archaeon]
MVIPVFPRDKYTSLPIVDRGEGVFLFDKEGKRYLDACSGACVVSIGHGRKEVAKILKKQAEQVAFVIGVHFQNEPAIRLAKQVIDLAPEEMSSVHFVSGGSEGTDTAIKLALSYYLARKKPRKTRLISRWASYHGATIAATSVSGHTGRRRTYHRILLDVTHIPPAYCYRCPYSKTPEKCDIDCARALDITIRREGSENIAAFIAEPIVGSTLGAVAPVDEYFPYVREICDDHDVLLIADEVMTGFGRTGKPFGMDHWGVTPDIMITGKGISSGYAPLGAILVRKRIDEAFEETSSGFPHIFTYGFNPLSAAAGSAVLDILVKERLIERSATMGRYLSKRLKELDDLPIIGDTRGKGLLHGVEFVKDKSTKAPFPREKQVSHRMFKGMASRGVLPYIGTGTADGTLGDHFTLCPPFIITEEQIDEIIDSIDKTAREVATQL